MSYFLGVQFVGLSLINVAMGLPPMPRTGMETCAFDIDLYGVWKETCVPLQNFSGADQTNFLQAQMQRDPARFGSQVQPDSFKPSPSLASVMSTEVRPLSRLGTPSMAFAGHGCCAATGFSVAMFQARSSSGHNAASATSGQVGSDLRSLLSARSSDKTSCRKQKHRCDAGECCSDLVCSGGRRRHTCQPPASTTTTTTAVYMDVAACMQACMESPGCVAASVSDLSISREVQGVIRGLWRCNLNNGSLTGLSVGSCTDETKGQCFAKVNKQAILHWMPSCTSCGIDACGSDYAMNVSEVTNLFAAVGSNVTAWGCGKLTAETEVVRDSVSGAVYAVENVMGAAIGQDLAGTSPQTPPADPRPPVMMGLVGLGSCDITNPSSTEIMYSKTINECADECARLPTCVAFQVSNMTLAPEMYFCDGVLTTTEGKPGHCKSVNEYYYWALQTGQTTWTCHLTMEVAGPWQDKGTCRAAVWGQGQPTRHLNYEGSLQDCKALCLADHGTKCTGVEYDQNNECRTFDYAFEEEYYSNCQWAVSFYHEPSQQSQFTMGNAWRKYYDTDYPIPIFCYKRIQQNTVLHQALDCTPSFLVADLPNVTNLYGITGVPMRQTCDKFADNATFIRDSDDQAIYAVQTSETNYIPNPFAVCACQNMKGRPDMYVCSDQSINFCASGSTCASQDLFVKAGSNICSDMIQCRCGDQGVNFLGNYTSVYSCSRDWSEAKSWHSCPQGDICSVGGSFSPRSVSEACTPQPKHCACIPPIATNVSQDPYFENNNGDWLLDDITFQAPFIHANYSGAGSQYYCQGEASPSSCPSGQLCYDTTLRATPENASNVLCAAPPGPCSCLQSGWNPVFACSNGALGYMKNRNNCSFVDSFLLSESQVENSSVTQHYNFTNCTGSGQNCTVELTYVEFSAEVALFQGNTSTQFYVRDYAVEAKVYPKSEAESLLEVREARPLSLEEMLPLPRRNEEKQVCSSLLRLRGDQAASLEQPLKGKVKPLLLRKWKESDTLAREMLKHPEIAQKLGNAQKKFDRPFEGEDMLEQITSCESHNEISSQNRNARAATALSAECWSESGLAKELLMEGFWEAASNLRGKDLDYVVQVLDSLFVQMNSSHYQRRLGSPFEDLCMQRVEPQGQFVAFNWMARLAYQLINNFNAQVQLYDPSNPPSIIHLSAESKIVLKAMTDGLAVVAATAFSMWAIVGIIASGIVKI